jgi:hypothetical protein
VRRLLDGEGGGSLTALPIAETDAGNVSAYIPTNLISITDGQIILDAKLFAQGHKPAIDVGTSVSRVGGKTQLRVLRDASGTMRLDYAQFLELEMFTRFGEQPDRVSAPRSNGQALARLARATAVESSTGRRPGGAGRGARRRVARWHCGLGDTVAPRAAARLDRRSRPRSMRADRADWTDRHRAAVRSDNDGESADRKPAGRFCIMSDRLAEIGQRIETVRQLGAVVNAMQGIAAQRAQQARALLPAVRRYAETARTAIGQARRLDEPLARFPARAVGGARGGLILFGAEQGFAGAFPSSCSTAPRPTCRTGIFF